MRTSFPFLAGSLWLDFVNTEGMVRGERTDLLATPDDYVRWATAAGLKSARASTSLLAEAHRLRAALRAAVEALSAGKDVPASSLAIMNRILQARPGHFAVRREQGRYRRDFIDSGSKRPTVLARIVDSAVTLLCQDARPLVRRCDNPACILFFYDTTKNHGRRFCSAAVCGNRMKAAAHYRRRKVDTIARTNH